MTEQDYASDPVLVREAPSWVRTLTATVVATVAVIAFLGSYGHMQELGHGFGEGHLSYLTPFVVDGLAIAASMVLLVRRRADQSAKLARFAQVVALGTSLAANIAAADPTTGARLWAAILPVGLFLAYELLLQQVRVVDVSVEHVAPVEPTPPPVRSPEPVVSAATYDRPEAVARPEAPALPEHTGPVDAPAPKPAATKAPAKRRPAAKAEQPMSARASALLPLAFEIATDARGRLNRDDLRTQLGDRGETASTGVTAELMRHLRQEGKIQ